MSEVVTKQLDAIEAKARVDVDYAVPDASRFDSAGAGIIAGQMPKYVREVAQPLVEEIERLKAQRDELREAAKSYHANERSLVPGVRVAALERLRAALEAAR